MNLVCPDDPSPEVLRLFDNLFSSITLKRNSFDKMSRRELLKLLPKSDSNRITRKTPRNFLLTVVRVWSNANILFHGAAQIQVQLRKEGIDVDALNESYGVPWEKIYREATTDEGA